MININLFESQLINFLKNQSKSLILGIMTAEN